nr:MAG TPA: hypothetical protein [Caudoviricetes sp.]
MDHRTVRFKIQRRTQNKIKPGGCPQWTPWKGVQTMLELFSKLFWSNAKSCVLAPAFREIFQIAFKSNFVRIVWSIGFQASRTKREPRAEIGGRGCMQGARPVIRAIHKIC